MASTKKEAKAEQELTLEEVQKQIAAMLAAAEAKAAEILDRAEEAAKKIDPNMEAADIALMKAADKAKGEELVEIKLFKDSSKYKDDVFVSVNGETIAIKRGERVKIKRKFVEVLDNSERQDYETAMLIERKTGEYEAGVASGKL
jgi:hypothetical protein